MPKKYTNEQSFIGRLKQLERDKLYIMGTFKSLEECAEFHCQNCGTIFTKRARYATKRKGYVLCADCAKAQRHNKHKKGAEIVKSEIEEFAPSLHLIVDTYESPTHPAKFFCDIHCVNHSLIPEHLYAMHWRKGNNYIVHCKEYNREMAPKLASMNRKHYNINDKLEEIKSKWHIECISSITQDTYTKEKLLWRCMHCGHEFYRTLNSVLTKGSSCKRCCKFVSQTIAFDEFKKFFPDAIPEYGINFDGHRYRFDAYSASTKVGLEWNGIQHYSDAEFFSSEGLKFRDAQKKKYAKRNGIKLIVLNGSKIYRPRFQEETIRNMVSQAIRKMSLNER